MSFRLVDRSKTAIFYLKNRDDPHYNGNFRRGCCQSSGFTLTISPNHDASNHLTLKPLAQSSKVDLSKWPMNANMDFRLSSKRRYGSMSSLPSSSVSSRPVREKRRSSHENRKKHDLKVRLNVSLHFPFLF